MLIIGITGTLGAGKGTIVDYLVEQKKFTHFSVRGYLLKEIRLRGIEENRDNMVAVANELRKKYGSSYIVEQLYQEAKQSGKNTIIESIRNTGEIEGLKKLGTFILLAVDAAPDLRYQRIVERQSETDRISYNEFIANEQREMESSDPNAQNIKACMDQADFYLENNGTIEELHLQIDHIITTLNF
jgi:dephospho-CoA kinase